MFTSKCPVCNMHSESMTYHRCPYCGFRDYGPDPFLALAGFMILALGVIAFMFWVLLA